jgi:hypothetical protein
MLTGSVIGGIFKVKNTFWDYIRPHLACMRKFSGVTKEFIN